MDGRVTYLETGSLDPHYNLAFEEYVLCSRRSGFVPYPELGSELYRMNRADQERIRAAVEEALCPLTGVTVLSVEPVPGASGLEVRVELEADGASETAGLLLTL